MSKSTTNTNQQQNDAASSLLSLLNVMAKLRHPEDGCAWDIKQTHATIAPYTIEEAYEVAEAVLNGDKNDLRDELGDLLLQVVFQARIAEENGDFAFADIAASITDKMIRRHPHIFGDATERTADEQRMAWEDLKASERAERQKIGVLDDVATTLPPMTRAAKLQKRASRVGFDWTDPTSVLAKVHEELEEVTEELNQTPQDHDRLSDEIGDLLFSVINLARKSGVDPDDALGRTNRKFIKRFAYLEAQAKAQGVTLNSVELEQMEVWWQAAKD